MTLVKIADSLGTTPTWLVEVVLASAKNAQFGKMIDRITNAANGMSMSEIEFCLVQVEAVVAAKNNKK